MPFGVDQALLMDEQRVSEAELAIRKHKLVKILDQVADPKTQVVKSKQKSIYLQTRSNRGSKFRGVSKNGKKWQVSEGESLML